MDSHPQVVSLALSQIFVDKEDGRLERDGISELAASMKGGLLNPIAVRPVGKKFRVIAGRRRFAAATALGWSEILAHVLNPTETNEVVLRIVENDQREDVHPLDQAASYAELQKLGHSVAAIAELVGRPERHVYDRIRLNGLNPMAAKLFRTGKIAIAHALILARLKDDDQLRAIAVPEGFVDDGRRSGLWRVERGGGGTMDLLEDEGDTKDPLARFVARTAAELQDWVDHHVRFDRESPDLPQLFEATHANLIQAAEKEEKVVPITREHHLQDGAKDAKERTYGPMSWKRADGGTDEDGKSKICERAVLGVFVAGHGRGETMRVCIDKNCDVHWRKEKAEKRAAEKAKASGNTERAERIDQKRQAEEARAEQERERWKKAQKPMIEALAKAILKAPATPQSAIGKVLLDRNRGGRKEIAPGKTAESLLRYLAFNALAWNFESEWNAPSSGPAVAKAFGIDWKQILDEHAPVKPAAAPQAEKKGTPKKKRTR